MATCRRWGRLATLLIIVHMVAVTPRNIPPNQHDDRGDDGRQEDEPSEGAQRDDGAQVQASSVRLLLVVVHGQGDVHVGRLVSSKGRHRIRE